MKSQDDLISIIVPTYNGEKYIKKCLESILNQTYKKIEIIVVVDGSTDDTESILKMYSALDNRLKVFVQKNRGVSIARNNGIKNSAGVYLTFVDDDDYIEEDYISNMYNACKKNNWDIVKTGFSKFSNDKFSYYSLFEEAEKELDSMDIKNIFENSYAFNSSCMMLINKSILEKNNILFNTKVGYAEDFLFTYTLFSKSRKYGWINNCGYNCRINMTSNSRTGNIEKQFKNIKDAIFVYQNLFDNKNDNNVSNKILFIISSQLKAVSFKHIKYRKFISKIKEIYTNDNFENVVSKLSKNTSSGNMKIFSELLRRKSYVRLYLILKIYDLLKK